MRSIKHGFLTVVLALTALTALAGVPPSTSEKPYLPVNLVDNPGLELVNTWTAYADAAATSPVDGTGGSPTVTCTRGTSSDAIIGAGSLKITKPASNVQGQGCAISVTIPTGYRTSLLKAALQFKVTSGTVADGDVSMFAYDVTNGALVTPRQDAKIVLSQGQAVAVLDGLQTTAAQIRFIIHIATTSTSAFTISVDDIKIAPNAPPSGAAQSDPVAFTPTFTGLGTVSNVNMWYVRMGKMAHIYGTVQAGTVSASAVTMTLPGGASLDTSTITATDAVHTFGPVIRERASATPVLIVDNTNPGQYVAVYDTASTSTIRVSRGMANSALVEETGSTIFTTSDRLAFNILVPISGWASNLNLGESVEFEISSYLANGTKVTSTPDALGEYRVWRRSGASTDAATDDAAQSTLPTVADGMKIHSVPWTSAGTSGQAQRWDIFIGKKKYWRVDWWPSTGHSGYLSTNTFVIGSGEQKGVKTAYDAASGVLVIDTIGVGTSANAFNYVGQQLSTTGAAPSNVTSGYFDVTVSSTPLNFGFERLRSSIFYDDAAGYGATNTKVPYFTTQQRLKGTGLSQLTNDSTSGLAIQVNQDGLLDCEFGTDAASGAVACITINGTALTTNCSALTYTQGRRGYGEAPTSQAVATAVMTGEPVVAGDIIRPQADGTAATANTTRQYFKCTLTGY